mmetsp:Transcript_47151/g.131184  ORF Transcript_47151/g.131184 Transcript_47151/m.131184 type:complete len:337 (-) Transcript_47151:58-1068(-)
MFTQNTSLACWGILASQAGELGCPTKRPSSESKTRSKEALKASGGTPFNGLPKSSSVHQWRVITSLTRKSCVKGPSCSSVSAFRKTRSSIGCRASSAPSPSWACPASSPTSCKSAMSLSSLFDSSSDCSWLFISSLVALRISIISSHLPKAAPAMSFLLSMLSSKKVCAHPLTRLGSMRELPSSRGSMKLACQSRVITPFSNSCTASPTSSENSCCPKTPCKCTALTRPSSCRGRDSRRPSRSTDPSATCMKSPAEHSEASARPPSTASACWRTLAMTWGLSRLSYGSNWKHCASTLTSTSEVRHKSPTARPSTSATSALFSSFWASMSSAIKYSP